MVCHGEKDKRVYDYVNEYGQTCSRRVDFEYVLTVVPPNAVSCWTRDYEINNFCKELLSLACSVVVATMFEIKGEEVVCQSKFEVTFKFNERLQQRVRVLFTHICLALVELGDRLWRGPNLSAAFERSNVILGT